MFRAFRSTRPARLDGRVAAAALILVGFSGAAHAGGVAPDGLWYDKDKSAIIKMHPCAELSSAFCGTIVWLKDATEPDGSPKLDNLNKDPAKKNKPMIGLEIFTRMVADDDHWKGKVYNAEDGKIYDVTFTVKTDKEPNDIADIRGCLLGFLCRTEQFSRAPEVPGGDPTALADAGKKKKAKKETAHK